MKKALIPILISAGTVTLASAQEFISGTSKPPTLTGTTTLIDFESATVGSGLSFNLGTATIESITSGINVDISTTYSGSYNTTGKYFATASGADFKITFAQSVSSFAINWGAADKDWTIKAYNAQGALIGTFALPSMTDPSSNAGEWVGVRARGIKYVTFEQLSYDYVLVDNLIFTVTSGPSAEDTLNSMRLNSAALRGTFNLQNALISQGLSNDCTIFSDKGYCFSFVGNRFDQNASKLDFTSGTALLAYRHSPDLRFGGYINQNFGASNQGGLRLERSDPGLGVFANYTLPSGVNLRLSYSIGKAKMQTTREVIDSAEAGSGSSAITSKGVQVELSKAFDMQPGWTALPYAGIRQTTNKRAGYTEVTSDSVTAPLTYAELKQKQSTAFAGVRLFGNVAEKTLLMFSAGLEHDTSRRVDDYSATGVDDLGSINMKDNLKRTRPVFGAALSYEFAKNDRASVGVQSRREAFDSKSINSIAFTYTKGF